MSDPIDEFLTKLKKELEKKNPKPVDEYDPDWLKKYDAQLTRAIAIREWKAKPKVERIIERQEAIDNRKFNNKHH